LEYNNVIIDKQPQYTSNVGKGAVAKMTRTKKSEIDDNKIRIIHTMNDGTNRDSIDGYEIPYNDTTAIAYKLMEKWTTKNNDNNNREPI
jgi:hypothetical protein